MHHRFLLALATLVGTIVGAGIFGLPYVAQQAGLAPTLFYFVLLGGVVLLLHLMFGEVVLRTPEKHRLIGYASLYLGDWAKKLVTISTVGGIVGALLAYIIVAGDFLHIVLDSFIPLSSFSLSVAFWLVLSLFIFRGIQTIAKMELLLNAALFLAVGGIFVSAFPHVEAQHFKLFDPAHLLLPYGVVLFAFWGLSAIPELAELFRSTKEKRGLDNLIVYASLVSGGLFFLFLLFVVGVSGEATSQDALTGLVPFLGERVVALGALFGLIAVAASFLVLGNYLKNSLRYDYRFPYGVAVAVAVFAPIALFVFGVREFIAVLGVVGAGVAAFEGSLVAVIWQKAKTKGLRKPEYALRIPGSVAWPILVFLAAGTAAELLLR